MSDFRTYNMNWPELCNAGFTDKIIATDATYVYEAFAETGTAASASYWCVKRTHLTTGSVTWCGGSNDQIYAATNLPGLFN